MMDRRLFFKLAAGAADVGVFPGLEAVAGPELATILPCDGRLISKSEFPELFDVIIARRQFAVEYELLEWQRLRNLIATYEKDLQSRYSLGADYAAILVNMLEGHRSVLLRMDAEILKRKSAIEDLGNMVDVHIPMEGPSEPEFHKGTDGTWVVAQWNTFIYARESDGCAVGHEFATFDLSPDQPSIDKGAPLL